MSGFDFDALRDPDAPRPGARERAEVDVRARRLRARTRLNRLALSSVSVVAVVALVLGVVASQRDNGPEISVQGPITTAPSSIGDRFVPPTSTDNGVTTVPVTFPDGETTTLSYPEGLRVAQLGFAGGIGVNWPVDTGALHCCSKVVGISYDTIEHVYGKDATPIKVYRGADGQDVPFFHSPANAGLDYLVYQFGPWLVQVYDVARSGDFEKRMTDDQRATWARSLTGTIDANGYLVLHAAAPLSIGDGFDGGFGADPGNHVELATHQYCGQPESDSGAHRRSISGGVAAVSWCVGNDLHVSASGTRSFVDGADPGLRVSPLASATPTKSTTTTTKTTQPAAPPSPAVSASFVSPQRGWVLEQNGAVAETSDGGASWHDVGTIGRAPDRRIRFADATQGYAFNDVRLLATLDGGKDWSDVATPFHNFADLAITKGTVYVASYDTRTATVDVWTAAVGTTRWTKHPTGIPIGAGPIPYTQLVFAGGPGLLLQVDRTVVGGAAQTGSGDWTPWVAPCASVNGPAYLAASSLRDVVASCSEHDYGGGPIQSSVWFSHDGGGQFTRMAAPAFGQIASPNANTAVVAADGVLRRTTDAGRSWTVVAQVARASQAADLGFTTSTQGFAIFGDGTMLMTHDAGATWQKVTLP